MVFLVENRTKETLQRIITMLVPTTCPLQICTGLTLHEDYGYRMVNHRTSLILTLSLLNGKIDDRGEFQYTLRESRD